MILPTVAVVAVLEPLTAAKRVQPMMLQWSSRPGMRLVQGASPRKRRSDMSVRKMISPMKTNIGIAASSQVLAVRHMVPFMTDPIRMNGKSRRKASVESPTIRRATNIQFPRQR